MFDGERRIHSLISNKEFGGERGEKSMRLGEIFHVGQVSVNKPFGYKTSLVVCFLSTKLSPLCLLLLSGRYVEAKKDRVTVIFSTVFKDADDIIIGKVFMQVCFQCTWAIQKVLPLGMEE